jgi:hypothetical protein
MLWSLACALKWRGVARVFAVVPWIAAILYAALVLIPDWSKDPSSHNLLPFELGFVLWPSLPYIAVVALVRHANKAPDSAEPPRK